MTDTAIEWTDKTWNPVTGCTKVSPGCAHCYAEGVADRFWSSQYEWIRRVHPEDRARTQMRPRVFTDVMTHGDRLDQPLRWKKPARIFVNSMSDLFHEDVSDEFIDRVFAVMALAPHHTFQVLTKRAERMRAYMAAHDRGLRWLVTIYRNHDGPAVDDCAYQESDAVKWTRDGLDNVWLGVSVENQHFADERIPTLLQTPAAVRFISAEPLLGPVDLGLNVGVPLADGTRWQGSLPLLDWVIVGGESGPQARPCALEWINGIVKQCSGAVPCFVKQLGAYVVSEDRTMPASMANDSSKLQSHHFSRLSPDEVWAWRAGLQSSKGGDPSEWPSELRVREFPR